jgi:hypothetical protein
MELNFSEKKDFKFGLKAMILKVKVKLLTSKIASLLNLPLLSMFLKLELMD